MLKPVQNLTQCVQICSNVFKYVLTCSNLFITCANVIKWVQMCSKLFQMSSNVFTHLNPNNWGKIYQPFQCKGSDMTSSAWSSFQMQSVKLRRRRSQIGSLQSFRRQHWGDQILVLTLHFVFVFISNWISFHILLNLFFYISYFRLSIFRCWASGSL